MRTTSRCARSARPRPGPGLLDPANSRLFALEAGGQGLNGWPAKIGKLTAELLPVVGEGVTGSPVIGPAECSGAGVAVGAIPDAGLGHPAFGNFGGGVSFLAPAAGLRRALDAAVNEYQQGSQDFIAAWSTRDGRFKPGFPSVVNDLQFLTGPSVADVDGRAGEELLGGTASQDLYAVGADGRPVSAAWPKLTSDWMVSNPLVGTSGDPDRKVVVALTRSGTILAYRTDAPTCSPSSWPRFHHDEANSGDLRRDATPPGAPANVRLDGKTLRFSSPGDDLLCGRPDAYEVSVDGKPFTRASTTPVEGGSAASIPLSGGRPKTVSVRAVDEQGNLGRAAAARR